MRSLLTFSSRPSRRLLLLALFALVVTVVNGVPAKAADGITLSGVDTAPTATKPDAITVSVSNGVPSTYGGTVTFSASCGDCFTITPNDGGANTKQFTFTPFQHQDSQNFNLVWTEAAVGTVNQFKASATVNSTLSEPTAGPLQVGSNVPAKLDVTPNVQTGAVVGQAEAITVNILNPQGGTNPTNYTGTVTFSTEGTCSNCFTITPNDGAGNTDKYTYAGGDNGTKQFQLTWTTAGTGRKLRATGSGLAAPSTDDFEEQSGITVQEAASTTTSSTTTSSTTSSTTSTTAAPRVAEPMIVTGAGAGGGPHVLARAVDNLAVVYSFYAYDPAFTGGVRVAAADVNNDGFDDIITGPGPGGGPHIKVYSGKTGVLFAQFMAYTPSFTGGVFVAGGDVNGDGKADVIVGADAGGGPHVRVFDLTKLGSGVDAAEILGFFAYGQEFHGGVRVAAGDFDNDNKADVVTAPGAGGGPHVIVRKGTNGTVLGQFMAYGGNFTGGVFVAADPGGEGLVYTGAGPGGGEHVRVLNLAGAEQLGFFASAGHDGAIPAVGDSTSSAADVLAVSRYVSVPKVGFFDFDDGHLLGDFPAYGAAVGVFSAVGVL